MITYTSNYYQLMTERLLSILYIWCFATLTSCFAQKESISELYTQLDRAMPSSLCTAAAKPVASSTMNIA